MFLGIVFGQNADMIHISKTTGLIILFFAFVLFSCSKKSHPSRSPVATITYDSSAIVRKTDTVAVVNKPARPKAKPVFPKVITVNDSAASKSVDGRYYYDVMGHRYWRNNKDGKYYLFDKSMYNNDDFKSPANR
jgi:hypothetical protein